MGNVNFKTTISGGAGNLDVSFDNVPDVLHFDENNPGPLTVALQQGVNNYTVVGNAAPGGNIHLDAEATWRRPNRVILARVSSCRSPFQFS